MRLLVVIMSVFLSVSVASAQTTISFDPGPEGPLVGGFVRIGGYVEDGIVFSADPEPGSIIVEDSGGVPSNGTAFLSKCGVCRPSLRSVDGSPFDLLSLELGELLFFGFGPFATVVTITGFKEDGSTVVADITTDGLVGFETVVLDAGFVDLVSAEIATASPYAALAIDDLAVVVGLEKPTLAVSPPSGTYVTLQAFDITLIVAGEDTASAAILDATLDGLDFRSTLADCAIDGRLDAVPGVTFRCPLDAAELGTGTHTFEAIIELDDGSTATDRATWQILGSSEP